MNPAVPGNVGQWVCLQSAALGRFAAVEMLAGQCAVELPAPVKDTLRQLTAQQPNKLPLQLWVKLDPLAWAAQQHDEHLRVQTALEICIQRQAHYPLIRRLFKISRREWQSERKRLGVSALPTAFALPDAGQVAQIYAAWSRLLENYDNDLDRWVVLGEEFPTIALACLYPIIYIDDEGDSRV